LRLSPAAVGATCSVPGASQQPCTTACGSSGAASCGADCVLQACVPPAEQCNGVDDDCDDQTDEGCPVTADAATGEVDAAAPDAEAPQAAAQAQLGSNAGGCASARSARSSAVAWITALGALLLLYGTRQRKSRQSRVDARDQPRYNQAGGR